MEPRPQYLPLAPHLLHRPGRIQKYPISVEAAEGGPFHGRRQCHDDGGYYGSGNDTGLDAAISYGGGSYGNGSETSAGGETSYGESSSPGVTESSTEAPGDTSGMGGAAQQTASAGYSNSVTSDGEFVLHSTPGSELHARTPDGRHIMRQSDGSLWELHFGDETGRMRSTPYNEQNSDPYAQTARLEISTASLLDDYRFYNRDIARGYKELCEARRSREVERQMAACGLGPDPVDKTPGVVGQPVKLSLGQTNTPEAKQETQGEGETSAWDKFTTALGQAFTPNEVYAGTTDQDKDAAQWKNTVERWTSAISDKKRKSYEEEKQRWQEAEAWDLYDGTTTVRPGPGKVTSEMSKPGETRTVKDRTAPHKGTDFSNEMNGNVVASDAGMVINTDPWYERNPDKTYKLDGNGNKIPKESKVVILHNDGSTSTYLHTAPSVRVGDYVRPGQAIGKTDLSGNPDGPHIHYERRDKDGYLVNPRDHLSQAPGTWLK